MSDNFFFRDVRFEIQFRAYCKIIFQLIILEKCSSRKEEEKKHLVSYDRTVLIHDIIPGNLFTLAEVEV
jgi:hypothetical protein